GTADAAFEQIDVADKVGNPARAWLFVYFGGRRDLHQATAIHYGDAVRHRHGFALIVRDDDECESKPALQIHQLELRLAAQFFIQRRHRLIEQEHARPLDQRTGERDTLTLSAG